MQPAQETPDLAEMARRAPARQAAGANPPRWWRNGRPRRRARRRTRTTPMSGSFAIACEPSAAQGRIAMHVPKPLMAVSLAVLSVAVVLGCFAQVF